MLPALLVLTLLCSLPGFPQQAADHRGDSLVVRGRVIAAEGGASLAGARVTVLVESTAVASAYSDRDGSFSVPAPVRGSWRLLITKAGCIPAAEIPPADMTEPSVVRLLAGAAVTGRVLDERGDPLPSVHVRVRRVCPTTCAGDVALPAAFLLDTDDRGVYRVGSLPSGSYAVDLVSNPLGGRAEAAVAVPGPGTTLRSSSGDPAARGTSEPPEAALVDVRPGAEAIVHLARAEAARLPLAEASAGPAVRAVGAIVRGRVLSAIARPVADAAVQATSLDGTVRVGRTDAEGRYEIFGLAAGSYRVTVARTGVGPVAFGQQRARQQGTPIALGAGEVLEGIDLRLPPSGVVTGRVVDAFGEPLEG